MTAWGWHKALREVPGWNSVMTQQGWHMAASGATHVWQGKGGTFYVRAPGWHGTFMWPCRAGSLVWLCKAGTHVMAQGWHTFDGTGWHTRVRPGCAHGSLDQAPKPMWLLVQSLHTSDM